MTGNRGGRFHRDDGALGKRRWASRQWICCVLDFKDRRREVWRSGYTELFFLDEVTALAAGHRPCFECRRQEANHFRAAFARGNRCDSPAAPAIDRLLHAERLQPIASRTMLPGSVDLPDGMMASDGASAFALRGDVWLPWQTEGYGAPRPRQATDRFLPLTPPSIVAALRAGYRARWHPSAAP